MTLRLEKTRDFILCKQKTHGWADPHSSLNPSGWTPLFLILLDMSSLEAQKYGSSSIKQCWMES